MALLEDQKKQVESQKSQDERELRIAEQGSRSLVAWQTGLKSLKQALTANDDVELRLRLNTHLRELIDKIEVFAIGHRQLYDEDAYGPFRGAASDGEDLAEQIDAGVGEADPKRARSKDFRAFLKYVTARRMSKDGRFLRVHFKTGAIVDIVPPGSIASGDQLTGDPLNRWKHVAPRFKQLWHDYEVKSGVGAKL